MEESQSVTTADKRTNRAGWFGTVIILFFLLTCCLSYAVLSSYTFKWQVDGALAKWRAQNVEEYEMVVDNRSMLWYGTWTLRVNSQHVELVSTLNREGTPLPVDPSIAHYSESLRSLTVEAEFAWLEQR